MHRHFNKSIFKKKKYASKTLIIYAQIFIHGIQDTNYITYTYNINQYKPT